MFNYIKDMFEKHEFTVWVNCGDWCKDADFAAELRTRGIEYREVRFYTDSRQTSRSFKFTTTNAEFNKIMKNFELGTDIDTIMIDGDVNYINK